MEIFPLDSEKVYFSSDMLTLDCESGPVTQTMTEWLRQDPVRIHRMIVKEKVLQVDQMEVFAPLVSKLRRADYEYYKRITGLTISPVIPPKARPAFPTTRILSLSINGGARAKTKTRFISRPRTSSNCSKKSPRWNPK